MALSRDQAQAAFKDLKDLRETEQPILQIVDSYVTDESRISWLPQETPADVVKLAKYSRVNFIRLIVTSLTQQLFVDGYRSPGADEEEVWGIWQKNRMDARQIGIHNSTVKYGVGYGVVLAGDTSPVIRGATPLKMTTLFDEEGDDFPSLALWRRRTEWWLIEDELIHRFTAPGRNESGESEYLSSSSHGFSAAPVVRFRDNDDLDHPVVGNVTPHINLQEQINITTFALLVAQHFGAHRLRYILGWMAKSEADRIKASGSKFLLIDDPDVKVGEFQQTILDGYISSREASLRHLSALSQTPTHELLGALVNLSAEALATTEKSRKRLLSVIQTMCGEAWEQVFGLCAENQSIEVSPDAWVWWRDMEAHTLAEVADALGKFVTGLGIPQRALWERIPGVTKQQLTDWDTMAEKEPDPQPAPGLAPAPVPGVPPAA